MAIRNDFSTMPLLINSALCLSHYLYMWQTETIAPINKWSYPAAFTLMLGGNKLTVVANNMIHGADDLGPLEAYRETLLKAMAKAQDCFILFSTVLPIMTYLESCHFLSKVPTMTDITISFLAFTAMVAVRSYYANVPVPG
jgi:hypothetical protein